MKKAAEIIETIEKAKKEAEYLPTGFTAVDQHLDGGFLRKELVVLGGSTGSGKSYLAGQIMNNVALKGFKCAYFSLEITNELVLSRLVGQMSNVKASLIMTSYLSDYEEKQINKAESKLMVYESFMDFYDDVYELEKIRGIIQRQMSAGEPYEFIIIDFIQNIFTKERDEYSRLTSISLELQRMAKEFNCCILVLSQLSNINADARKLEYKGSGAIAMVADLGFFIQRGDPDLEKEKFIIMLMKNRRGMGGVGFEYNFTVPGGKIQ